MLTLVAALGFSFSAEATNYTAFKAMAVQAEPSTKSMEKQLLGPYSNIQSLTASNLRHAYMTFMDNVRAKHGSWTKQDWNQANAVINKLNARENSMNRILSVTDKAQIKILQTEFNTLYAKATKE